MSAETPPIVLTIAGSDPSGGAGIQADLKTFTVLGVFGTTVITALTAQNTLGVTGVLAIPPAFIAQQFETLTADLAITAVKTGMLADAATVETVAGLLKRQRPQHLIVDPVMVATSGDRLIDAAAAEALRRSLVPLASLITPNLPEAAALLGCAMAETSAEVEAQARSLLALGCQAVLIKGGHGKDDDAVDVLASPAGVQRFTAKRIATKNTHGTGCTLSAAITANLALGLSLTSAVAQGKAFVHAALTSAAAQKIGAGHGPADHLFSIRR